MTLTVGVIYRYTQMTVQCILLLFLHIKVLWVTSYTFANEFLRCLVVVVVCAWGEVGVRLGILLSITSSAQFISMKWFSVATSKTWREQWMSHCVYMRVNVCISVARRWGPRQALNPRIVGHKSCALTIRPNGDPLGQVASAHDQLGYCDSTVNYHTRYSKGKVRAYIARTCCRKTLQSAYFVQHI